MAEASKPARGIRDLRGFFNVLFEIELEPPYRRHVRVVLAVLFLLGIYFWGSFFNWGRFPMTFGDWAQASGHVLDAVRDAIRNGQLPLHTQAVLQADSNRFLADVEVVTTPQALLLGLMDVDTFVVVDVLLSFSLAFAGLLWLRQHFRLSLVAFAVFYALFGFNGYIQAHYAVGNISWASYFLLPLYFCLCVVFVEQEVGWRWVAAVAVLLAYVVLAGGWHFFVWMLLFLAALLTVGFRKKTWLAAAILCSGLLTAFRMIPPAMTWLSISRRPDLAPILGYPSLSDAFQAMAVLRPPSTDIWKGLWGYWEYDFYLGALGLAFLLYFGAFRGLSSKGSPPSSALRLLVPALLIALLVIGNIYAALRATTIPFFQGERLLSRMLCLPVFAFLLAGSVTLQAWLREQAPRARALVLLGLIFMANDLWLHSRYWNVAAASVAFPAINLNLGGNRLVVQSDPSYFLALKIGAGISLITLAFLIVQSLRERGRERKLS